MQPAKAVTRTQRFELNYTPKAEYDCNRVFSPRPRLLASAHPQYGTMSTASAGIREQLTSATDRDQTQTGNSQLTLPTISFLVAPHT